MNTKVSEKDKYKKKKTDKTRAVKNILKLRKALNLSQEELAFRTGVSRQTISKWEASDCNPSMSSIEAVARGLNISTSILMCEGEIDFKELARLYAKQKCDEEGAKPLTLPENKRGQKYIDNEISRELTDIHLEKSNIDKTPVVNEDEIKQKALEEAKKNFVPYLYPTLSGNGNTEKARIHKKIIGKILRILIAIILLTYAGFSIYKFVVLSQLIKKIKGLNNINNYYAEILEYNDTTIKEKNYVWYKDGMFKINTIKYDDSGIEKETRELWINSKNKTRYYYDVKQHKIKEEKILVNGEVYSGMNYVFSLIPKQDSNGTERVIKDCLNPIVFITINNEKLCIKEVNKEMQYEKVTGIPMYYFNENKEKIVTKNFKVKYDCVNDETLKIAYN